MSDDNLILLVRDATPDMQITEALPAVVPMEMAAVIKGEPGETGPPGVQYNLQTWAMTLAFSLTSAERNTDDAMTSATIEWPDGVAGTFVSDVLSVAFPGAVDAWHGTHGDQIVTQPLMTRNSNGAVIAQPAPIIS
jgi:hypothetical protein